MDWMPNRKAIVTWLVLFFLLLVVLIVWVGATRSTQAREDELESLVAETDNDVLRQVARTWMKESFEDAETVLIGAGRRMTMTANDKEEVAIALFEGRIRLAAAHQRTREIERWSPMK